MTQFSGELFDGTSTRARLVGIQIGEEGLLLSSNEEQWIWPYSHICDIQKVTREFRCTLKNDNSSEQQDVKHQLCFTDSTLFSELQKRILETKSFTQKHLFKFWNLGLWQILIITIIVLAAFISIFYTLLLKAYSITPYSYDTYLGKKIDSTMSRFYQQCSSPELDTFLQKAVLQLSQPTDRFAHHVVVLNDSTENAVSLPGGKIYLFRGLLESSKSPDEILGVISHEIAHAEERHSVRQIIQSLGIYYMSALVIGIAIDGFDMLEGLESTLEMSSLFFTLHYSRKFENEADSLCIERMHKARLKVGPLDSLLTRISPPPRGRDWLISLFSTHPMQKARSKRFSAARNRESFPSDTIYRTERLKWNEIKKSCPNAPLEKPFWKKIISQTNRKPG